MAASYVAERKAQAQIGATSAAFSPASNCTAGNMLVLVMIGPTGVVSGVTDSKGNTWTVDQTRNQVRAVSICSTIQDIGALITSDTITVTTVGSTGYTCYWLEEFSGQYVSDKTTSNAGTSGTALNTGTTAATADADEFVIAGFVANKSGGGVTWTWTKDAAYTNFTTAALSSGSQTGSQASHYRILSATGTQICSDTVSATMNSWSGVIVTYKASGGGANTYTKAGHGVEHG